MASLPEYSYVKLVTSIGELPAGAEGTIVGVYPDTQTYMIEFFVPIRAVETVAMEMVETAQAKVVLVSDLQTFRAEDTPDEFIEAVVKELNWRP